MYVRDHKLWGHWVRLSPNHSTGRTITPRFLVMHFTAGWSGAATRDYFLRSSAKVAAHLVIDRSGEVWNVVPFHRRAWHAGPSRAEGYTDLNSHSIGIELDNPGWVRPDGQGGYLDWRGDPIPPEVAERYDFVPASHPRMAPNQPLWARYTAEQLQTLDEVVAKLLVAYPTIRWIVGHDEIDTRGWKTDPGPLFPMERYRAMLDDRGDLASEGQPEWLVVHASSLNVRGGPGVAYDKMDFGPLSRGTRVQEIDRHDGWVLVRTDTGDEGWCSALYLIGA